MQDLLRWKKNADRFGFDVPGVCRYLKFYDDSGGDTLTFWTGAHSGYRWQRKTIRYDDIKAIHFEAQHLVLVLKQGEAGLHGFNLPRLIPLLEKRLVRSVREMNEDELLDLEPDFGMADEETGEPIMPRSICSLGVFFCDSGSCFVAPESAPEHETLH